MSNFSPSSNSNSSASTAAPRFSEATSFSPLNQHQYSPFSRKAPPPVFETVDIDSHFTSSASSSSNNKKAATASPTTSSYFVHREVLGQETSKLFEKTQQNNTTTSATNARDSDSDSDDEDIPPPPPPSDPYPFDKSTNNMTTSAAASSTAVRRPPPPVPNPSNISSAKNSPQQPPQDIKVSPHANGSTNIEDLSTEKERHRFVQTHHHHHHETTTNKNTTSTLTEEEMLMNDDDDEEDLDQGEEDYSILHTTTDWKKQNKGRSASPNEKYHHKRDFSESDDDDEQEEIDPENQPEFREIETMFHQLRLEQRVAGELAGVLRESSVSHQSYAVKIASEKAKELKRLREDLLKKENLQVAREQETSYQQEEVSTQNVKRLDGITDVLERSIEAETLHFTGLRDLEDRIIDKQRAAQIKKMELQRLQELAEDCISQLTTFELRNTARERMISNLENDLEKRSKEAQSGEKDLEERIAKVQVRERKISEWVEALETKEKHLTNQDTELQNFADEFLRREEAVRNAKKEHQLKQQMQQHQAQNVNSMAGTRFHHEGPSTTENSPTPAIRKPPGFASSSSSQPQMTKSATTQPTTAPATTTSTRFATPSASVQSATAKQQQQRDQTPEALDRDDDDGYVGYSPGVIRV